MCALSSDTIDTAHELKVHKNYIALVYYHPISEHTETVFEFLFRALSLLIDYVVNSVLLPIELGWH